MTSSTVQRDFALQIVSRLQEAGHQALWAGGCVRDLLLHREPKDYDVATSATPEQVRRLFGRGRTLAIGESFGVIIVLSDDRSFSIEVATFRNDGAYVDGRRPESVHFGSPQEDAQRRDFTINGMFYDPLTNQVADYVDGQRDLEARLIRAIGDPFARFTEDKLRVLRAVRFAQVLDFTIDPQTAEATRKLAGELRVVSWERITQEVRKMLVDRHRARGLELARDLGLLAIILPEVERLAEEASGQPTRWWQQTLALLNALPTEDFEVAFALLLRDLPAETNSSGEEDASVPEIGRRFRLSNDETETIAWLVRRQHDLFRFSRQALAWQKTTLADPRIEPLVAYADAFVRAAAASPDLYPMEAAAVESFSHARTCLATWPREKVDPPLLLTGRDLIDRGLKPGPQFKSWLEEIRTRQLNEEVATREQALAVLDELRTQE